MIVRPGARIDRYEIVRAVASGGMGTVWLARMSGKHGFAKRVAIKTIRADLAADDRARAMFVDEARIAMRIEHAHVAQVLDVVEHDRVPCIVLEWIDGVSLEHLCASLGGPMPVAHVLRIAADACAGLDAAHELRDDAGAHLALVHRDVSPHNILVGRSGIAKIIDFGIAKARDRLAGDTDAGIVRGKRAYMSPEQVAGRPLDRRADLWAMGAVIYRAVAGHAPFDDAAAFAAYADGRLAPAIPPEVPPAVRDVVLRALAVSPGDRWQTAADLQRALEDAMTVASARVTSADVATRFASLLAPTYDDDAPSPLSPTVPAELDAPRSGPSTISAKPKARASPANPARADARLRSLVPDAPESSERTASTKSNDPAAPSSPPSADAPSPRSRTVDARPSERRRRRIVWLAAVGVVAGVSIAWLVSRDAASTDPPAAIGGAGSSTPGSADTGGPASNEATAGTAGSSTTNVAGGHAGSSIPADGAVVAAGPRTDATSVDPHIGSSSSDSIAPNDSHRSASPARAPKPPRFAANDPVSFRYLGEWRDAIVEGTNRDGTIAIHVLGATRAQRDVDPGELRPRKRLPPIPIGQTVRVGKLTCTVAEMIGTEDYMLACPFDQRAHAQRSSLTVVP